MNYPSDFDTPTFSAGRKIVSMRLVGIAVMILFLLILCTCGVLFWAHKSIREHPFLVSVNTITGQWETVGQNPQEIITMSPEQSMQESVLTKFMQYWFWISSSDIVNNARWRQCNHSVDCGLDVEKNGIDIEGDCAIYCLTGDELYNNFVKTVLPIYHANVLEHNTWQLDMKSLILTPLSTINASGGIWQVQAVVYQNGYIPINVLGYAQISKGKGAYQKTLGYYVSKFNSYKMD